VALLSFLLVILVGIYGRGTPSIEPSTLDAGPGADNELASGPAGA
jgi:hypothetical protein